MQRKILLLLSYFSRITMLKRVWLPGRHQWRNLSGPSPRRRHSHHLSRPRRRRGWWWGTPRMNLTKFTKLFFFGLFSIKSYSLTFLKVLCCLILFLMDCGAGEPISLCRSGIWTSSPWPEKVKRWFVFTKILQVFMHFLSFVVEGHYFNSFLCRVLHT